MDSKASIPSYTSPAKVPWTTTRCNRLLRPLKTRLDAIRKHVSAQAADLAAAAQRKVEEEQKAKEAALLSNSQDARRRVAANALRMPGGSNTASILSFSPAGSGFVSRKADPDWVPDAAASRRNCKRKYSAKTSVADPEGQLKRSRGNGATAALPGEISVPSPLLSRTQAPAEGSSSALLSNSVPEGLLLTVDNEVAIQGPRNGERNSKSHKKRWLWPKCGALLENSTGNMTSEQRKLFNSLLEASENLLRATMPKTSNFMGGTRSLFAMCLRQMPRYIALEDHFRKQDNPDYKEDTASDIFEHLETLSSAPGRGWTSLREIVRAQAVSMIVEAIIDEILSRDMINALGRLFAQLGAYAEAQELVAAYLNGQRRIRNSEYDNMRTNSTSWPPMHVFSQIDTTIPKNIAQAFRMRTLNAMLASGRLPVENVASKKMSHVWRDYVIPTAFQQGVGSYDAANFISTTVRLACDLDGLVLEASPHNGNRPPGTVQQAAYGLQDALSNTVSSLLSILASIILDRKPGQLDSSETDSSGYLAEQILYSLCIDVAIAHQSDHMRTRSEDTTEETSFHASIFRRAAVIMSMLLVRTSCKVHSHSNQFITVNECVQLLEGMVSLQHTQDQASGILEGLPKFICGIAACRAQIHGNEDTLDDVHTIIKQLLRPESDAGSISTHATVFLRRLALDTAHQYARAASSRAEIQARYRIVDDIELELEQNPLEGVSKSMYLERHTGDKYTADGHSPQPGNGYRWEPGLAEWVAATPLKGLGKARVLPERTPPKRRIKFEDDDHDLYNSETSPARSLGSNDELDFSETEESIRTASSSVEPTPLRLMVYNPPVNTNRSSTLHADGRQGVANWRGRLAGASSRLLTDITNTRKDIGTPKAVGVGQKKPSEHERVCTEPINRSNTTKHVVKSFSVAIPAEDEDELALSPRTRPQQVQKKPAKIRRLPSISLNALVVEDEADELSFCD